MNIHSVISVLNLHLGNSDKILFQHDSRKSETQTHPPKLKPVKKTIPKFEDVPKRPPKLTRAVHWPTKVGDEAYTSVHVAKDQKEVKILVSIIFLSV